MVSTGLTKVMYVLFAFFIIMALTYNCFVAEASSYTVVVGEGVIARYNPFRLEGSNTIHYHIYSAKAVYCSGRIIVVAYAKGLESGDEGFLLITIDENTYNAGEYAKFIPRIGSPNEGYGVACDGTHLYIASGSTDTGILVIVNVNSINTPSSTDAELVVIRVENSNTYLLCSSSR